MKIRIPVLTATALAGAALAFPAVSPADQYGGGPAEPILSGFGSRSAALVCHDHPGVTVFNKSGIKGRPGSGGYYCFGEGE